MSRINYNSQLQVSLTLISSCRAAGCALFLPGEFGTDSSNLPASSFFHHKRAAVPHLDQLGLPYLQVLVGAFYDTTFAPGFFGFDLPHGKAHILGTGDEMVSGVAPDPLLTRPKLTRLFVRDRQYSLTATADITSYLGALLTTLPPPPS